MNEYCQAESLRIQSLHSLCILDTSPEDRFDRITKLAQKMFRVPVALVSLVDRDRQWFKSCQGLSVSETPRDIAFCHYSIQSEGVMVVEDALKDERFCKNPLVLGEPKIRFYAGFPLKGPNQQNIGTLCIIDFEPRSLLPEDAQTLVELARTIEDHLYTRQMDLERRYDLFFDLSSDLFCIMDLEGGIKHANPSFYHVFQNGRIQKLERIIHPGDTYLAKESLERVAIGQEVVFTCRCFDKRQKELWLAWKLTPYLDKALVYSVARDVTKEKLVERELEKAKDHAIEMSKAKGNFLSNMSHEIRSPMNGILGFIELVLRTDLNVKQKKFLSRAKRLSQDLLKIVNQIVDFSKTESGKMVIHESKFRMFDLIDDLLEKFGPISLEQNIRLVVDKDPMIPATLKGDVIRLQQVLQNLLSNAFKFTKEGYVVLLMKLKGITVDGAYIHFEIVDTGVGIEPQDLQNLFQPFQHVDVKNKYHPGARLGLSISQNIVRLLGGQLDVQSSLGKGTRFFFELPFGLYEQEHYSAYSSPLSGQKVLLLETEISASPIRQYLEYYSMTVTEVNQRELLVKNLSEYPNDFWQLIILGFEFITPEVVEVISEKKISCIVMSDGNSQTLGSYINFDASVLRPINLSTLLDTIIDVLGCTPRAPSKRLKITSTVKGDNLLAEENSGRFISKIEKTKKYTLPPRSLDGHSIFPDSSPSQEQIAQIFRSLKEPMQKGSPSQVKQIITKIKNDGVPDQVQEQFDVMVQQVEIYHFNSSLRVLQDILSILEPNK